MASRSRACSHFFHFRSLSRLPPPTLPETLAHRRLLQPSAPAFIDKQLRSDEYSFSSLPFLHLLYPCRFSSPSIVSSHLLSASIVSFHFLSASIVVPNLSQPQPPSLNRHLPSPFFPTKSLISFLPHQVSHPVASSCRQSPNRFPPKSIFPKSICVDLGNYTEEELEEYMQSHKKVMIDSLWKLNVADIEATLSHVLQDNSVRKEELRARVKGLKTLGKIFQSGKTANGSDTPLSGSIPKLNGNEQSNDGSSPDTSPKSMPSEQPSYRDESCFINQG
ncbi:hypothetical protein ACLOJK_016026 [Asimina triloba]